jgi:methyl-accepting chemotaxis protein
MKINLQTKIIGGFMTLAVVCFLVGIIGWSGSGKMHRMLKTIGHEEMPAVQHILKVKSQQVIIKSAMQALMNPSLPLAERQAQNEIIVRSFDNADEALKRYERLAGHADEKNSLKDFIEKWQIWKSEVEFFLEKSRAIDVLAIQNPQALALNAERAFGTYKSWAAETSKAILEKTKGEVIRNAEDFDFGIWLKGLQVGNEQVMEARDYVLNQLEMVIASVSSLMDFIDIGEYDLATDVYVAEVLPSIDGIQLYINDLKEPIDEALSLYEEMVRIDRERVSPVFVLAEDRLDAMVLVTNQAAEKALGDGSTLGRRISSLLVLIVLLGTGFAVLVGLVLSRIIATPITRIIDSLTNSTQSVSSSAVQVSSGSHELAAGASQQAASLEETSASLEEMLAMTKQNAANADEADRLMREITMVVERASQAMDDLTSSMQVITNSSQETSKIVKTIDEIAFQTNLLALNAAVEAARAGEAGAGFAVVADEVRNLAMRAAEAAKTTADLIDNTVKNIGDGSVLVLRTGEAFEDISKSTARATDLVSGISVGSNEQAQGISQLSKAVSEMDSVVQRTAATAEESAAAAEELSSMALELEHRVGDLMALVEGGVTGEEEGRDGQLRLGQGGKPQALLARKPAARKKAAASRTIQLE